MTNDTTLYLQTEDGRELVAPVKDFHVDVDFVELSRGHEPPKAVAHRRSLEVTLEAELIQTN